MRKAVIVIGCSYGDEGKGLAAAQMVRRNEGPCLNVLINGGAQRGHTVDLEDGRRHVFHHFGAGAMFGAVSCADEDFIVNPMLCMQEREELQREFSLSPRLMVSAKCRVSTVYDMMLGQIIEENRGAARHGSCGCGIYETRLRFETTDWALRFGQLRSLTYDAYAAYCRRIVREYMPARLKALGMTAGEAWRALLEQEGLILGSWADLQSMLLETECYEDWALTAAEYPLLVFEAGQGLALDEFNMRDFPHLTPSSTTSLASARRIAALKGETQTQILYVTRTYLTRHGAGPLPTQCAMEDINHAIVDRTNMPNPHQQAIRYGMFDAQAVLDRVQQDCGRTREVLPDAACTVLVTHLNETGGRMTGGAELDAFMAHFDEGYISDCPWSIRRRGGQEGREASCAC